MTRHEDDHEPYMWPTANDVPWQVIAQATLDREMEEARACELYTRPHPGRDAIRSQLSSPSIDEALDWLEDTRRPPRFTLWPERDLPFELGPGPPDIRPDTIQGEYLAYKRIINQLMSAVPIIDRSPDLYATPAHLVGHL